MEQVVNTTERIALILDVKVLANYGKLLEAALDDEDVEAALAWANKMELKTRTMVDRLETEYETDYMGDDNG